MMMPTELVMFMAQAPTSAARSSRFLEAVAFIFDAKSEEKEEEEDAEILVASAIVSSETVCLKETVKKKERCAYKERGRKERHGFKSTQRQLFHTLLSHIKCMQIKDLRVVCE
jgi:hypothetical protein